MANLTQNQNRPTKMGEGAEVIRIQAAAVKSYAGGAAVIIKGIGYAQPFVANAAGQKFSGVYLEDNDNSNGVAGTISHGGPYSGLSSFVNIQRSGFALFNQSGLTEANVGDQAFFVDDNTIAATGSMAAGEIVFIDENASKAWVDITTATMVLPGSGLSYRITTPATITNVNGTAQVFGSLTVPANTFKAGDIVRIRAQVKGKTRTSTDTVSLNLKYGTTTIATLDSAFAHASTNFLYFDVTFVITTNGASGTCVAGGIVSTGTAGATLAGVNMAAATAIDTTVAETFTINGTFSASNTTDQADLEFFDIAISHA